MRRVLLISMSFLGLSGPAAADGFRDAGPIRLPEAVAGPAAPVTSDALATAPRPEAAAVYTVPPEEPADRPWRRRALLLPRFAVAAALAPLRFAVATEERYHVKARARELFWNDAHTVGMYPVATWEGGRDVAGGAALSIEDLGGTTLSIRGTAGVIDRYDTSASFATADALGPVTIASTVRVHTAGGASFHGIGEGNETAARFGFEEQSVQLGARWRIGDTLSIAVGGSRRRVRFGDPVDRYAEVAVPDAYDVAIIPGWQDGIDAVRGELSLRLDRRSVREAYQSRAVPSTGWAAQAYGGWQRGVGDDTSRFGYGGLDVLRAIDLFGGDRVLTLRGTIDAVMGDAPFVDLPSLGGTELLRGYTGGRFRDQWIATSSAEYTYPVTEGVAGFVFVDAGRTATSDVHATGGLGIQLHSRHAMTARAHVAVTDEGGVAFSLRFEPVFAEHGKESVR